MITPSFMYKWKQFGCDVKDYTCKVMSGVNLSIEISKHFSHRIYDRFDEEEHTLIRRMIYHVINRNLCEVLFWHQLYINKLCDKPLVIRYDTMCIVCNVGHRDNTLIIRTAYKQVRDLCSHKFYTIKIK